MWIKKHYDEAEGRRKLRFSKPLWGASLLAAAVLALGVNGTLGQFVAQITNNNNHVTTASFSFSESNVVSDPTAPGQPPTVVPCVSANAGDTELCPEINKYGEQGAGATPMAPGDRRDTTVRLTNESSTNGGIAGNLALDVAACQDANTAGAPTGRAAGDLCGAIEVYIVCTASGTQVAVIGAPPGSATGTVTLTALAAHEPMPIPIATDVLPGDSVDCAFTTSFPAGEAFPEALQDVQISQELTWVFTQA